MKTRHNVPNTIFALAGVAAVALAAFPQAAAAQTYTAKTVSATDSIEAAGQTSAPDGATFPTAYAVNGGGTLTFTSVTGSISFNGGGNFNDPDGVGSASATNIGALNGISSISAPTAGYLVGLFTTNAAPSGTAPAGLTFVPSGGTGGTPVSFTSLSPLLNQTFFIGDGRTGDGTGAVQQFFAPAGATKLYLGFADAPGYNGSPGSYGDNSGAFTASFVASAPEPSAFAGLALGVLGLAGLAVKARRRTA